MAADRHDFASWMGGYPWPELDLPCRRDPDALDGLHVDPGDEPSTRHCDPCPVTEACLTFALEMRIDEGVYGGTTGRQRRTTLADLRRRYQR